MKATFCTMTIPSFVFLLILVAHAYPSASSSAEDLFSTSDPDMSDNGALASFQATQDPIFESPSAVNTLDLDDSTDTSIFLPQNLPAEDSIFGVSDQSLANTHSDSGVSDLSLASIDEGYTESLFENESLEPETPTHNADSLTDTTGYDLGGYPSIAIADSPPVQSYCEDSSTETGDDIPDDISDEDLSLNKEAHLRGPGPTFTLDPTTPLLTKVGDAYATDGTPIQPQRCKDGKYRSCCIWNPELPFQKCWYIRQERWPCQYAKNMACCAEVPWAGFPGVDCEESKWVKSRDTSRKKSPENPPNASSFQDQLQELFPVLRGVPPLQDSNPAYCKPRSRS